MDSARIYDLVAAILRGESTTAPQRQHAFDAPIALWQRVLGFDGCAVHFDRAVRRAGFEGEVPAALGKLLRDATNTALRNALLLHAQLAEIAPLCAREGIRVMALKGAARLLAGELPATRSVADVDLLTTATDAARLHTLLQRELGYAVDGAPYAHHLAGLTRRASLGIEVHVRLAPTPLPLDAAIWRDTRVVTVGEYPIEIPSPTNLLLHTIEHAVRVNWSARYRLRDIADVSALLSRDVDIAQVEAHLAASECRRPMRTLLSAANARDAARFAGDRAWRTVRRVGRARLALAATARRPRIAERWFRYVGMLAEGSPRTVGLVGVDLTRRLTIRVATAALALVSALTACEHTAAPRPIVVTPFVFASESGGSWALYRFRDSEVARLSTPGFDDREPSTGGGRVVFTSMRDGDAEIYSAALNPDLTFGAQTRLTSEYGNDDEPALSPAGETIAFVSGRNGTPRIWLMNADGANPRALDTGSPSYIPEGAPHWSPSGDRIAFTSTRTGPSQVYVVAAAGGTAEQLSHETRGAFTPSWMPDGRAVLYTALSGGGTVMSVPAAGGDATVFASDAAGLGEAACSASFCVAVRAPSGSDGSLVALTPKGAPAGVSLPRVADDHHPALLGP